MRVGRPCYHWLGLARVPKCAGHGKNNDNQGSQKSTGGFCHVTNLLFDVLTSHGVYNPKHNDRSFDVENVDTPRY